MKSSDHKSSDNKNTGHKLSVVIYFLLIVLIFAVFIELKYEIKTANGNVEQLSVLVNQVSNENKELENEIKRKQMQIDALADMSYLENSIYNKIKDFSLNEIPEFSVTSYNGAEELNSTIIEKNIKQLGNIQNYGSNVAIEYIDPDKNKESCYIIMSKIKSLSDEICIGAASDTEKADLIAKWEAETIFYDHDAANENVDEDVISLVNVLSLNRTTCAGYSNFFSALCEAQGIVSINLRGGVLNSDEYTIETIPTNHEWNAVYCDGNWRFYDVTWASYNSYSNNEYLHSKNIDENCIGMDFYEMSKLRRIDKADYRNFYAALFEYEYNTNL